METRTLILSKLGSSNFKRILIVEDDLCLQTLMSRLLQSINKDIDLHWVTTAEEALMVIEEEKQLSGRQYDLIVSDIFLPGKRNGLDLLAVCQRICPDSPVLLTSGMPVDQFLKAIGRDAICPPYLPKPFFAGECRQLIEGLLGYAERKLSMNSGSAS